MPRPRKPAKDWSANSTNSLIPDDFITATNDPILPAQISTSSYQAESAMLRGDAKIEEEVEGAEGGRYVRFPGVPGLEFIFDEPDGEASSVQFTVDVPEKAWYTLDFRYANGSNDDAHRNMLVDGEDIPGILTFPNLFSGESWGSSLDRLELTAGRHRITLTNDLGDEAAGATENDPEILLDQLQVTRGTTPSDNTNARSLLMNNSDNMVAITEAALLFAMDIEAFGPSLAQLRHASNWNVDQIDYGTMWFRDVTEGAEPKTFAPYFDSTHYYDEHGIVHVDYGDYLPTGEALPISISREYAMVPNQPLLVERWTLQNQNDVGSPLIEWDVMNALRLNPQMTEEAVWDERRESWIARLDQGEGLDPLYLAFGSYQETTRQGAGPDGEDVRGDGLLPFDGDPGEGGGQGVVGGFEGNGDVGGDARRGTGQGLTLAMETESVNLEAQRPIELFYYYTLADSLEQLDANIASALNPQGTTTPGSPTFWFSRTEALWDARLSAALDIPGVEPEETVEGRQAVALPGEMLREIDDPALETGYLRSLVSILQSQQPEFGSFVAATNPAYEFKVWPRDSAATAIALDGAGLHDDAERYWKWMASVEEDGDDPQFPNGSFATNYSFWEPNQLIPFVQPEWDAQGLFLIGVYRHHQVLIAAGKTEQAEAFVNDPTIREAVVDSAQFIATRIEDSGFGPHDFSIWEEIDLYNPFTQVTYAQGLNAASLLAGEIGRPDLADSWAEGARTIREAILRPITAEEPGLWNEEEGYLIRGITPDGQLNLTLDNSANLAIVTGLLDADDPRARAMIENTLATSPTDDYGIPRYIGDTFYNASPFSPGGAYESRVESPVWPQMTSYVGLAKEFTDETDWTQGSLGWTIGMYGDGFTAPGEGVDWSTREPLPSTMVEPVTAGWYVQNLLNYTNQFDPRMPSDVFTAAEVVV
ncbi:hypothetical protein CLG96_06755 [Sphingomonas oleivorans]|uniref:CBM6 domain-containing protein n=1 Tax=Sphingomonas oleivorans TaxID=1735121 RepID=A0A2T5FZW6_9SPHN|nr:glycoside hydrolase family 15 protein [Sphingomonas oleivorans]PTQ12241.1 hypothetical protein CLG96_06755 [Sphingomonas oleivorans]